MKIIRIKPMSFRLDVLNPYIICFHHNDLFPKGKPDMSPIEYLPGRNPNGDFDLEADWRMYYGDKIPGFPVHPHRGFETITVVTSGYADHFDSKGSKGRYGEGDVQWMTAGKGIQHSEMFPLINEDKENHLELFQIWLNLPRKSKMVEPSYKMLWSEDIPLVEINNGHGKALVKVLAGEFNGVISLDPTPHSWAYDRKNNVRILLIELEQSASLTLNAVSSTISRMLYAYSKNGAKVDIEGTILKEGHYAQLKGDEEIEIKNTSGRPIQLLLLEGEPINEPISAHGPYVMNSREEIIQAFKDYEETQFGGWPWKQTDPVNSKEDKRFASYDHANEVQYPEKQ